MEIETKEDSYGNTLYRVKPPVGQHLPLGWFKTEQEAIEAYEKYQKA